jgi:hypothetical protein
MMRDPFTKLLDSPRDDFRASLEIRRMVGGIVVWLASKRGKIAASDNPLLHLVAAGPEGATPRAPVATKDSLQTSINEGCWSAR